MPHQFNSIGASGKMTCGACCKLCQGVISVSGNHINGINNLDIPLKDLKCDGKIARQYVAGIQRQGIKKQLKYCKVSNFRTQALLERH